MSTAGRLLAGSALCAIGLIVLTGVLVQLRTELSLASIVLLYLLIVVATAALGGLAAALAAAVASDLVVNYYFVPPYHTLSVENRDHVITLLVYMAVATTVSLAMDIAARQRATAARTGVEAALLARISAEPVREGSLNAMLGHVREVLHRESAALVESTDEGTTVVALDGRPLSGESALTVPAGPGLSLVVEGPPLFAPDPRFLSQLATAAARTLQAERVAAQAARARELAEVDKVRAALLAAVGHDLRTPLAGIKASVSSLRDPSLELPPAAQTELLETIEVSADRMADLVENLLAMSRLRAGALSVHVRPVALDEVVAAALVHSPPMPVTVDVPDDLPLAQADPGLLERVVANLLTNAHQAAPGITVTGRSTGGRLELAVVDHGRGIPEADRERMFAPFQRLGDHTADGGLGLGLAIARGFTEAMNGTLTATDTPGGGMTMTITLPAAGS